MKPNSKIFVLGLSRTGTTSVHAALVLMGYGSVHYPANAARRWLAGSFKGDVLEHYDACLDLPTPIYYPQLDERYPGSKFILLERDLDSWLDSVRRQWQAASKPSPKTWLRDSVRIAVYGTVNFNASRLSYVYQTHQKNTKDYFKDRPHDFISLNIPKGDGWDKLCSFLGRDKPADIEDFPRFRTPYIGSLDAVKRAEVASKGQELLALIRGESDKNFRQVPEA